MTATILDFVGGLADTLAWPVVVTTLALVFKDQVGAILSALQQRIKHLRRATGPGNTSVEFDQFAEEADAAALELPDPIAAPEQLQGGERHLTIAGDLDRPYFLEDDRRKALSVESPAAALLIGYAELESQLRSYYEDTDHGERPAKRATSPVRIAERLASEGHVPMGFTNVLRPIAAARNAIAHGQVPEQQDRAELRELVEHCSKLAVLVWNYRVLYKVDPRPLARRLDD